jgi:hypothetical protein
MQPARQKTDEKTPRKHTETSEGESSQRQIRNNEIGVINGVRGVLVAVGEGVRSTGQLDPELDESVDMNQLWIEVAPPTRSIALLLSKEVEQTERDRDTEAPVFLNCEDFHRTYNDLINRGANFLAAPAKMPFGWLSMFEDGYGRRFVLGQW